MKAPVVEVCNKSHVVRHSSGVEELKLSLTAARICLVVLLHSLEPRGAGHRGLEDGFERRGVEYLGTMLF